MNDGDFTILTVCQGNIHRSALAAALLRTWADWYLPAGLADHVVVGSAGMGAPVGQPMRGPVLQIAAALGADGSSHRARQISDDLIRDADLVLTATRRQRDEVLQRVPAALRTTFTIREAGRIAAGLDAHPAQNTSELRRTVSDLALHRGQDADAPDGDDITDPEGGDDDTFRVMAREEVPPLAHLGAVLLRMPRPDLDAYVSAVTEGDLLRAPS